MRTIRDAIEADLPAIVAIYNSTIPSRIVTADVEPVTVESRRAWFHNRSSRRPLWVMEIDNVIAGWLSVQSFYGRPAYSATAELSVYVSSDYRRRGVATELMERAIVTSPSLDITTLLGFIFAENEPSVKLFKQFGFEQWGFLPDVARFDAESRNLVILGKRV
jgi:L-amino acid N-acyltransferase YncA